MKWCDLQPNDVLICGTKLLLIISVIHSSRNTTWYELNSFNNLVTQNWSNNLQCCHWQILRRGFIIS